MSIRRYMDLYIGTKVIFATEMSENSWRGETGRPTVVDDEDGYLVEYSDGYRSWSPKEQFEVAYRKMTDAEIKMII